MSDETGTPLGFSNITITSWLPETAVRLPVFQYVVISPGNVQEVIALPAVALHTKIPCNKSCKNGDSHNGSKDDANVERRAVS